MRISDWSSDVCSSDLMRPVRPCVAAVEDAHAAIALARREQEGLADVRGFGRGVAGGDQVGEVVDDAPLVADGAFAVARHREGGPVAPDQNGTLGVLDEIAGDGARGTVRHVDAGADVADVVVCDDRSEEHTSELQSLMRISYAVCCLKKK